MQLVNVLIVELKNLVIEFVQNVVIIMVNKF